MYRVYNSSNDFAIISKYNAYFRYYDGHEYFFREFSMAMKFALYNGYNFKTEKVR
jgi:hypothetical protein